MVKKLFVLFLMTFLLVSCNKNGEEEQRDDRNDDVVNEVENNRDDQSLDDELNDDEINEEEPNTEPNIDEDDHENESNIESDDPLEENDENSTDDGQAIVFDENEAAHIIENFQERLFVDVDDHLQVISFSTKNEIIDYIAEYASKELAEDFVDNFYIEEEGNVYIVPQGAPPFLNVYDTFSIDKQSETSYIVSQQNSSELHGEYLLNILIEHIDDRFIVTDFYTE